MRIALVLVPLLLAACDSPSPEFIGTPETRVTVEGTRIAVYRRGEHAQAIRLDRASRSEQPLMPARLRRAITIATGCTVVAGSEGPQLGLLADSGVLTARIACTP